MVSDDSPVGIVTKAGIGSESIKGMSIPYPTYQKIEAIVQACEVIESVPGLVIPKSYDELVQLADAAAVMV
jgi:hypothetical protein